ncbi:MAG: heme-binding domain-containing protein [Chitinophagaceae bacterium]
MKLFKKILLGILIALVVIQFFQPAHNTSVQVLPTDIAKIYTVPVSVEHILTTACYDCHSNNTMYPWYANTQPMAWFMAHHVKNGKKDLNFSEFGSYSARKKQHKFKSIASQVKDDEMPVSSYKLMHKNARLTKEEQTLIIEWANKMKDSLTTKNK